MVAGCAAARNGAQVVVLDKESDLAQHSTGRSAASLDPTLGSGVVQALTKASLGYFLTGDPPIATQRPVLMFTSRPGSRQWAESTSSAAIAAPDVRFLDPVAAIQLCSALKPSAVVAAMLIPGSYSIDTAMLMARLCDEPAHRGEIDIWSGAEVVSLRSGNGNWTLGVSRRLELGTRTVAGGTLCADVVVNAAGAWADQIAALAGADTLGVRPLRRTAIVIDGPAGCGSWPLVADVPETFYVSPWDDSESAELVLSPADAHPDHPCDASARPQDVQRGVDAMSAAMSLAPYRVARTWAGHRTFVADQNPVVGFDVGVERFFWCAALGGTGVQTAPAIVDVVAALLDRRPLPGGLAPAVERLSPRRLRPGTA